MMINKYFTYLLNLNNRQLSWFLGISIAVAAVFIALDFLILLHILMIFWLASIITWMYITGKTLLKYIPAEQKMSLKNFEFHIAFGFMHLVLFFIIEHFTFVPADNPYFIPFHAYFAFSFFYGIYFISKSLVAIEEKRKVDYFDYRVTFYKFCSFFPFTALPIQQRVQNIIKEKVAN